MLSARIQSRTDAESVPSSRAANRCCSSRSGSTERLQHGRGLIGLGFENGEFRYRRVPLDERREGSKAAECCPVQAPDLRRYMGTVRVDTDIAPFQLYKRVT